MWNTSPYPPPFLQSQVVALGHSRYRFQPFCFKQAHSRILVSCSMADPWHNLKFLSVWLSVMCCALLIHVSQIQVINRSVRVHCGFQKRRSRLSFLFHMRDVRMCWITYDTFLVVHLYLPVITERVRYTHGIETQRMVHPLFFSPE